MTAGITRRQSYYRKVQKQKVGGGEEEEEGTQSSGRTTNAVYAFLKVFPSNVFRLFTLGK